MVAKMGKIMEINKNLLESTLKHLESTEKFILKQAPDIMKELLLEGVIETIPSLLANIVGIIFGLWSVFTISNVNFPTDPSFTQFVSIFLHMLGFMTGLLCTGGFGYNATQVAKMFFTPKLYLMHKASSMLKKLVSKENE